MFTRKDDLATEDQSKHEFDKSLTQKDVDFG